MANVVVKRPTKLAAAPSSPDRDTDGLVRLQVIEDRDPQSGGVWHSFQIISTVRVYDTDYSDLEAALNTKGPDDVKEVLARVNASKQLVDLYDKAVGKGTGGVPNILLATDFGGSRAHTVNGRFTVHTEVFLTTADPADITQLRLCIGKRDSKGTKELLKKIGVVTEEKSLGDLLEAALGT